MKVSLIVGILAVLAITKDAATIKPPSGRANLHIGYVSNGDTLLTRQNIKQNPIPNTIQYQDLAYRGNRTTKITAIQATEVGSTQWANAWLISGGIGRNNATLRVQSARGYGYDYIIDIWGRYN